MKVAIAAFAGLALFAGAVTSDLFQKIGLLVLGSLLTFVVGWYMKRRSEKREDVQQDHREAREDVQHDRRAADARIADLVSQVDKLNALTSELTIKIKPFWSAFESKIIADLTHPSPQFHEMDDLLEKLLATNPETDMDQHITPDERTRLAELLEERITSVDPEITLEEKESAKLMKIIMAKKATEDRDTSKKRDSPSPDPPSEAHE